MAKPRVTVTGLRAGIDELNCQLESDGSKIRLETGGRNGYQAVDEYSVDNDGERIGSGVNRNVCCGSSRECYDAAWTHYYHERHRIDRARITELEGHDE